VWAWLPVATRYADPDARAAALSVDGGDRTAAATPASARHGEPVHAATGSSPYGPSAPGSPVGGALVAAATLEDDAHASEAEIVDLRSLIAPHASSAITIAAPATQVLLPAPVAAEVSAAVAAALDNVARHAGDGAKAWILVEELDDTVTVTVRDNGHGIPDGRLAEAERAGRLGVAQSIRGRVRDLGGTVTVTSTPGSGTEVELHIPR
jgi:hypothetical protein